jgi:PQQ-dependent catabolism-associated CXXCW motif protein
MKRAFLSLVTGLFHALASAQIEFPVLPQPIVSFSYEDKDWNVEAVTAPKTGRAHGPTPNGIPGARVVKTLELKALLDARKGLVVIDVLDSRSRKSIPGAFWMAGAGDGRFFAAEKSRFAAALHKLTDGNKDCPLVFLCVSSECWLSYNASLHALEAGYKDVIWYRGGTQAWQAASLDLVELERLAW